MGANDELKPCPFCGGEVELTTYRDEGWQIECENHDWPIIEWGQPRNASDLAADIGMFTWGLGEDAKAALIEAWNTRTPEQAIAATMKSDREAELEALAKDLYENAVDFNFKGWIPYYRDRFAALGIEVKQ